MLEPVEILLRRAVMIEEQHRGARLEHLEEHGPPVREVGHDHVLAGDVGWDLAVQGTDEGGVGSEETEQPCGGVPVVASAVGDHHELIGVGEQV